MLLLELAPTAIAFFAFGRLTSLEERRRIRQWIERQARGDQSKEAGRLAKLKRKAMQAANG